MPFSQDDQRGKEHGQQKTACQHALTGGGKAVQYRRSGADLLMLFGGGFRRFGSGMFGVFRVLGGLLLMMVFVMVTVAAVFFLVADQVMRILVTTVLGIGG